MISGLIEDLGKHLELAVEPTAEQREILTPEALNFVANLTKRFGPQREELLQRRMERQSRLDAGEMPDFLPETAHVRTGHWTVGPIPKDLLDRRVEITGPVDRKMVINALNSGAKVFMADFEDAHSPTWTATIDGQRNLRDAIQRTIEFTSEDGKVYRIAPESTTTLLVRPRGWHLPERHLRYEDRPVPGSLFDFGLYFFHNARRLLDRGTGPYFYIPKLEGHLEARLWNEVFRYSEAALGFPLGTVKVTVLIETILAAFEMDEILYELRDYIVGLNCGRWDYIFSFIKRFHNNPQFVLPDRAQVTMTTHFLRSYSLLLIKTCHRRGTHAMGGMAAYIPVKSDPVANEAALQKVREDKLREATDGHDGTWVAHPGLVPTAMEVFDEHMPTANQLWRMREDVHVTAEDLLALPEGTITQEGVENNVSAALRYMAAWLGGRGAVPIRNLMEDAATAEIARTQLWQWIRYPKGTLDDGRDVTSDLIEETIARELALIRSEVGDEAFVSGNYERAADLLRQTISRDEFVEFLTLPAYDALAD